MLEAVESEPLAVRSLEAPSFEEVHAEHSRLYRALNAGEIAAGPGFIAFFNGRVVDSDDDPLVLLERTVALLRVHPDRVVVSYID